MRARFFVSGLLLLSRTGSQAFESSRSAVVGFLTASRDTTIAGERTLPGGNVFTVDRLTVADGAATVALGGGSRITLGRHTGVTFERKGNERAAILDRGGVSFVRPKDGAEFKLLVGNVSIFPARGFDARAEVAATDQSLVVASREGSVWVEGTGPAVEVAAGKAIKLFPEMSQSPGSAPSPTAPGAAAGGMGRSPQWTRWVWCGSAGGAVGAIPLIVTEARDVSPHKIPGWEPWIIPGGVLGGELFCKEIKRRPPPPPSCTLTANPAVVFRKDISSVTISWTSKNATALSVELNYVLWAIHLTVVSGKCVGPETANACFS